MPFAPLESVDTDADGLQYHRTADCAVSSTQSGLGLFLRNLVYEYIGYVSSLLVHDIHKR